MANIKTLKDLTPGTVFDAGPIDVRVLDHMTNGTTLLIADQAVAWRPFSLEPMKTRPEEAPTPYPNDFSLSYLKDELNGPFLAAFDAAGGPIRSANIVTADWSLADHRGGFGYGNMKAKISLLPEALILEWPRRSARASSRRSSIPYLKAATSSSAPSAVLNLHEQKPESRERVRSADNP